MDLNLELSQLVKHMKPENRIWSTDIKTNEDYGSGFLQPAYWCVFRVIYTHFAALGLMFSEMQSSSGELPNDD